MGVFGGPKKVVDFRKLGPMIADLKKIKAEMLPDDDTEQRERAKMLKGFDGFQKKKHELNALLKDLREHVNQLTDQKKVLPADQRNATAIKLHNQNDKDLKTAVTLWKDLKEILLKDAKRKKLDAQELEDRDKAVALLGQELVTLTNRNSRVKGKSVSTVEDLEAINTRMKSRTAALREQRESEKRKRRERKKGGKDDGNPTFHEEDLNPEPISEQEQQWYDQVEANKAEQDELLGEISNGLVELKDLSLEMKKQLTLQKHMATEINEKMDNTIDKYKTANSRLKDVLEQSGGISRWCPTIICLIILLALVGYFISLVG